MAKKPVKSRAKAGRQVIRLLTPYSDYEYVEVQRDPAWFTEEDGATTLYDDEAMFHGSGVGARDSLGDRQVTLFVQIHRDEEPATWYFSLQHESFGNNPIYEWECDVPSVDMKLVRIECNAIRELIAEHVERDREDR